MFIKAYNLRNTVKKPFQRLKRPFQDQKSLKSPKESLKIHFLHEDELSGNPKRASGFNPYPLP